MPMKALLQPLEAVAGFDDLKKQLKKELGIVSVYGCLDSQKANLAAALAQGRTALLVAENERKARELYEDMRLYSRNVFYCPRRDLIFFQADISGNLLTRQRMQAFRALAEQENAIIVTSTGGCMDYLLPVRVLKNKRLRIQAGEELELTGLTRKLAELGYERFGEVDAAGQFAVRGDILDIFPLTEENPWRIEFFGDEVDSIRSFDPESQRSIENLQDIVLYPASEEPGQEEGEPSRADFYRSLTDSLPDYLPDDGLLILDEPARIAESAEAIFLEYQEAMKHRLEEGKIAPEAANRMLSPALMESVWERHHTAAVSLMQLRQGTAVLSGEYSVLARSLSPYNNQFPMLVKDLKKWKRSGYRAVLLSASRTRGKRLVEDLRGEDLNAVYSEDEDRILQPGEILVTYGNARRGFEYPMQKFVLITETDIFGAEQKKKRKKTVRNGEKIHSFSELSVGDFVVHESHGLGIYRGIESVEVDHVAKDYIRIEYSGGSSLYVPATSLEVLQKYSGSEGHHPRVNKLGGKEWDKTRSRVKGAVKDIAGNVSV